MLMNILVKQHEHVVVTNEAVSYDHNVRKDKEEEQGNPASPLTGMSTKNLHM